MSSPCKDCPNKGCGPYHSKCEQYQKFMEKNKKKYKESYTQCVIGDGRALNGRKVL